MHIFIFFKWRASPSVPREPNRRWISLQKRMQYQRYYFLSTLGLRCNYITQEIQILSRLEAPKRPSKLYKYHVLLLQKRGGREEHRGAEFKFLFSLFLIYV